MIGKPSVAIVLVVALLAGAGTTVWTLATMTPIAVPTFDSLAAATNAVIEHPNRIDNWTSVGRSLLGEGDPAEQVSLWLASIDPGWARDHAAEAMAWYSLSHLLAIGPPPSFPDFGKPESVAARKKAIDGLIEFSQKHAGKMRYWHWNTLAWAWVRSGQSRFARGALKRTEDAIQSLADDYPAGELVGAIVRLSSCWSDNGVGDRDEQIAVLRRVRAILDRRGEDAPSGFTYTALARWQWSAGDHDGALETVDLAQRWLVERDPGQDLRADWRRIANTLIAFRRTGPAIAALDHLAGAFQEHGEPNPQRGWNPLGWSYESLGDHDRAVDAWTHWLDLQRELVGDAPNALNLYNYACALALTGDTNSALDTLEKAIDAGWGNPNSIRSDRDLASLRSDPRFEELLEKLSAAAGDPVAGAPAPPSPHR